MIINANALHIPLADQSVHCIVTSPPYWGLRNYGVSGQLGLERTPEEYISNMVAVFRECWRVLRDDGTLWMNIGDSYANNGLYDPSKVGGFTGERIRAGKKGIMDSQPKTIPDGLKPKDLVGIPWRLAFALQADGWYLRSDIIWNKPNPMPESVTDRPTKSHEYLFLLTKSQRYYYDAEAIREKAETFEHHNRYHSKESLRKENSKTGTNLGLRGGMNISEGGRNRRSVWTIPTAPYKGAHFATFPPALVEPCIKAGTSERGCCPKCGKGWRRVIEKSKQIEPQRNVLGIGPKTVSGGGNGTSLHHIVTNNTLGWRPDCKHYGLEIIEDQPVKPAKKELLAQWELDMTAWFEKWDRLKPIYDEQETIPALVFDPFVGSGTTVKVAYDLGRRGVGLDLSLEYLDEQALKRIHNRHTARLF